MHYRALITRPGSSEGQGRVEALTADATEPGALLNHLTVAATLDLSRPVALMLKPIRSGSAAFAPCVA